MPFGVPYGAMELVVLNVAYPFAPVGPNALGDAEQAVTCLDAALTLAGHESFVMACEGSVAEGILLATPKPLRLDDEVKRRRIRQQYRFTLNSFLEKWPIDLIHMHGGDFYEYLPAPGVPVLVTLHLPADRYPEAVFRIERPQTFLQCVSEAQRNACPPCANLLPEIRSDRALQSAEMLCARSLGQDVCFTGGGERFSYDRVIEGYFSIYAQLVGEARALETRASECGENPTEIVHA